MEHCSLSGEPFCALVPVINLDFFNEQFNDEDKESTVETASDTLPETISDTPTKPSIDLLEQISIWYFHIYQEFGHYPNNGTLQAAWAELTGQTLTETALEYLRERIHHRGNSNA